MSFVLVRKGFMERLKGYPKRSWYLHLPLYYEQQEKATIPFTPAVQVYYAFDEALNELLEEGVANRLTRYKKAATKIRRRMTQLGLKAVLPPEHQSNSITSYYLPAGLSYQALARSPQRTGLCHLCGSRAVGADHLPHRQYGRPIRAAPRRISRRVSNGAGGLDGPFMKAIILAAGVGKRLWPVTQHRPKCLIEIGGRSLLVRYLEALAGVGVREAVIVVGYKQDMIRTVTEAVSAEYRCVMWPAISFNEAALRHSGARATN